MTRAVEIGRAESGAHLFAISPINHSHRAGGLARREPARIGVSAAFLVALALMSPDVAAQTYYSPYIQQPNPQSYQQSYSQRRYPTGFRFDNDWGVALRAPGAGVSWVFGHKLTEVHVLGSVGFRLLNYLRRNTALIIIPEIGYHFVTTKFERVDEYLGEYTSWTPSNFCFVGVRVGIGTGNVEGTVGLSALVGGTHSGRVAGGFTLSIGGGLLNNVLTVEGSYFYRTDGLDHFHSIQIVGSIDLILFVYLCFTQFDMAN